MNYKKIISYALSFSILFPLWASAIDPTTSGRILDNFKKQEQEVLFDSLPLNDQDTATLSEHEYVMGGLSALKEHLSTLQSTYTDQKNIISEKRMTLEDTISSLNDAIASTQSGIDITQASIDQRNLKIANYQQISSDLKLKIAKNRTIILSYLANIYSEENLIFNDNNDVDVFQSLILSDGSTDDIASDITYKSLVSILGQNFIIEYRGLIRDYTRNALDLQEEIESLAKEQDLLVKQKSNLDIQKNQREQLLEITKGQEALFQKYIESQEQAQEIVEKSWQDASDAYAASLDDILAKNGCSQDIRSGKNTQICDDILAFYRNEHLLKETPTGTGTNIFNWPVKPQGIATYFHDPEYYAVLHSQHEAIDIRTPQGTDIAAPADGYVSYLLPPTPGGYSYLALKHPDGYVTVYGHLSEILVKKYQFVHKGDIIARSGGAPGTPGAGPTTTGPHLHFEVWKDKNPIDPLRVLDTTTLNYADLPAQYQDKYISDVIEKSGDTEVADKYTKRFTLKGDTEEERQKYLLKAYATPDFQDWDMWNNTALEAGIDPSFLMCVGLAETTLGNHLKTPYNIGNVGNTDSGDTKTFHSPAEGLRWMVATFNNKYLSQYDHVSQLSRWGNSDGAIYASSNANWHNNNIRCLSALKGRWVEDDYVFRIRE